QPKCSEMNLKKKNNNLGTTKLPINLGPGSVQPQFNLGQTASNRAKPRQTAPNRTLNKKNLFESDLRSPALFANNHQPGLNGT
ncbi:MAG: hypothetical protein ACXWDN_05510, partial [Limisphaerales bacterium]